MIKEGFETTACSCGNITFYEFTRDTCKGCHLKDKLKCDEYSKAFETDGCIIQECVNCGRIEQ